MQSMLDGALPPGEDLWRFGVLQLLDDYESLKRHRGVQVASEVLAVEPQRTGHSGVDASFAALTCWLADRDGWTPPVWSLDPSRVARPWWFVPPGADADQRVVFESAHLRVCVAGAEHLLAMKVAAARVEQDRGDLAHLVEALGLRSADPAPAPPPISR